MTHLVFDWDSLGLGDAEDPNAVKRRLDNIHAEMLDAKGISHKPDKNSPGFVPSAAQAREVSVMSCLGIDPKDIALVLNIELKMLTMYYSKELKVAMNLANAMVARQALQMALSGRNPDMTKFWLKAKAGWTETSRVDLTTNGKDISTVTSKDKLKEILKAAGKAAG
jgi:hypothetical protein